MNKCISTGYTTLCCVIFNHLQYEATITKYLPGASKGVAVWIRLLTEQIPFLIDRKIAFDTLAQTLRRSQLSDSPKSHEKGNNELWQADKNAPEHLDVSV